MGEYILEMRNITKEFPGVKALDNVDLSIKKGEIHALCGENGAGKSTLMKVLSGVYPFGSYTGDIIIKGKKMEFSQISDSEKEGIGVIYQEFALVENVTIAENVFLGKLINKRGIVNWDLVIKKARNIFEEMGVDIDVNAKIKDVGVGQQQLVEIAKALVQNVEILILDEPTAALAENEVELLLELIEKLKKNGVTCVLITHKLDEVFQVADRVTVLRDGKSIKTKNIDDTNEDEIIRYMVGRELTQRFPESIRTPQKTMLRVENFNYVDYQGKQRVINANFEVRAGEIVGISGLMGAGRTELVNGLFGFVNGETSGTIYVDDEIAIIHNPSEAIESDMAIISEDRKRFGLIQGQTVRSNISISSLEKVSNMGILDKNKEFVETRHYFDELGVKASSLEVDIDTLSGGNKQKVLLARCLMTKPKVLFLDEPTRGIDVGAKYEIYVLMNKLAAEGTAIVMISSELPEIINMADRVLVMHEGKIVAELSGEEITQERVMKKASGGASK